MDKKFKKEKIKKVKEGDKKQVNAGKKKTQKKVPAK